MAAAGRLAGVMGAIMEGYEPSDGDLLTELERELGYEEVVQDSEDARRGYVWPHIEEMQRTKIPFPAAKYISPSPFRFSFFGSPAAVESISAREFEFGYNYWARVKLKKRFLYWYSHVLMVIVTIAALSFMADSLPVYHYDVFNQWYILSLAANGVLLLDFLYQWAHALQTQKKFLLALRNIIEIIFFLSIVLDVCIRSELIDAPEKRNAVGMVQVFRMVYIRSYRMRYVLFMDEAQSTTSRAIKSSKAITAYILYFACIVFLTFASFYWYTERGEWLEYDMMWARCSEERNATTGNVVNITCASHNFQSIFHPVWLSWVSTATVGYGDVVPVTQFGRLTGGVNMVLGLVLIVLPVAVISANYKAHYRSENRKRRLRDQCTFVRCKVTLAEDCRQRHIFVLHRSNRVADLLTLCHDKKFASTDHVIFLLDEPGWRQRRRGALSLVPVPLFSRLRNVLERQRERLATMFPEEEIEADADYDHMQGPHDVADDGERSGSQRRWSAKVSSWISMNFKRVSNFKPGAAKAPEGSSGAARLPQYQDREIRLILASHHTLNSM